MAGGWLTDGRRLSLATCCLCLVTGCVQGPNYVKPVVAVPDSYRFADPAFQLAPLPSQAMWWSGFDDPNIDGLVREALDSNRDLRIATARVDEFAAILAGTKSQASPQVGYGLSGSRSRA